MKSFYFSPTKRIHWYIDFLNWPIDWSNISLFVLHTYKIKDEENRAVTYPNVSLGVRRAFLIETPIFKANINIGLFPYGSIAAELVTR